MVSREWLRGYLFRHLTAATVTAEQAPAEMAEQMTDEIRREWLSGEVTWWRAAASSPRLTVAQRTMRLRVASFYEERLRALDVLSHEEVSPP
jgi:hypothetical protein